LTMKGYDSRKGPAEMYGRPRLDQESSLLKRMLRSEGSHLYLRGGHEASRKPHRIRGAGALDAQSADGAVGRKERPSD